MSAPNKKSALFEHCVAVYNAMLAESEPYDTRALSDDPQAGRRELNLLESATPTIELDPDDYSNLDFPGDPGLPRSLSVDPDRGPRIYTGYLTRLFKDLYLSVPYYSSVMENLKRMKCVEQIKRGGGPAPSQWALVQPPDRMLFNMNQQPRLDAKGVHKTTFNTILEQRLNDITEIQKQHDLRLNRLELENKL